MHFSFFRKLLVIAGLFALVGMLPTQRTSVSAQETTGGLQGTVKDPSGAVVPNAQVIVTGSSLVGSKEATTDASGYYRFANLPPGTYSLTVTAKGFRTVKREGLTLEVGHLPSIDISLEVGASETVVEVTGETPIIDTTTSRTMTNVTKDVIEFIPHGESFQSVIQFAPSARNEPLMGGNGYNNFAGTGGCSPTGCSNGAAAGYQVGGAADSENGYLVEGQDTANNIGGYSHTNVPFDFIEEVQVKTSGVEAEHGGALGGVANVIMKKGGNNFHGAVFTQYSSSGMSAAAPDYSRYDPSSNGSTGPWGGFVDPTYQQYHPKKDAIRDLFPGFKVGGPIKKDRLWFFLGFNPQFTKIRRAVDFSSQGLGTLNFDQNQQTYYTNGRIDASVTSKLRVYASWLYQYQRESGQAMPYADSTTGMYNVSSTIPAFAFVHGLGFGAPNNTLNVGADYTISQHLIATTRFGYYFENYRDFGFPTGGAVLRWSTSGLGAFDACTPSPCTPATLLPPSLQQGASYFNVANNINTTVRNANKHTQFNQDLAWYKSGWKGTHNFKFGYQLNQLSNDIYQRWNEPAVNLYVGTSSPYSPQGAVGTANCATFVALYGQCQGLYGWAQVQDYGSSGYALSRNHGFFFQDSWTVGHGITINAGMRIEKEYLPAENQPAGALSAPINFGWGDKIAPRLGVAWDVFRNGKLKVFGGYGVNNDIMKLNLAISSFGGQYWQNCAYALDTSNLASILPAFDSTGRYCSGPDSSSQANWQGGSTPLGLTFLENQNYRTFPTTCATCSATQEGVAPGLKPYRQHESQLGADYQLAKNLALEARWDRRRLDHAIEDSAIFNPAIGETFVIVNPGEGVNKTFDGFYNFLYGASSGCTASSTPSCPDNIPVQRNYDGLEIRLTKAYSSHWTGMLSYTYSRLWGNYSGLTSTDLGDAGGGRNSPNNSRAFDEPFFSWTANGTSASGLLPTDRPNALKGWAYYEFSEGHHNSTDIGVFAYAYSGTAQTSYVDVGYAFPGGFPTLIAGRGEWIDVTQDPTTGVTTVSNPYVKRTPMFSQADLNLGHTFKFHETMAVKFSANFTNLFNRRAVTAYYSQIDSNYATMFITPSTANCAADNLSLYGPGLGSSCYLFTGASAYSAYEHPYDISAALNAGNAYTGGLPITVNSQYGKPYLFQTGRGIRLSVHFTF
ncbi:MAG: carboxypeptidase regulatory-like domain-containing protein [Acidobacteriia bacterium]|nr:carboxypeptidase regulatory-like domain-containing protein [Terriglobia bacterium]